MRQRFVVFCCFSLLLASSGWSQTEQIDTTMISKIRSEAINRSQVMEILSYLTDVYGPRLTFSPEYIQSADWVESQLREWGISKIYRENFAYGKGWTYKRASAQLTGPRAFPLHAIPRAWSPGTKGVVKGTIVFFNPKNEDEFEQFKGKIKGAIVLDGEGDSVELGWKPLALRESDSDLLTLANGAAQTASGSPSRRFPRDSASAAKYRAASVFNNNKLNFLIQEGIGVLLDPSSSRTGGNIMVMSASLPADPDVPRDQRPAAWNEKAPQTVPQLVVEIEQYNRMVRMIQKGQKLKGEIELQVEWSKPDSAFNIIAEIPGTDLANEIVTIGGHLDSWHGGTGASDDAVGSAVCLEVFRIFKTLGLQPRRTIRIGLWGGEELGLLGSAGHVKKNYAERSGSDSRGPLVFKDDYKNFSVYFNMDNGSGKFRGIYLQGNEAARSIFRTWLTSFTDVDASTISARNTGGTDHLSFDRAGLPGFQFIQDPIEYGTTLWHSTQDVWDRANADDVKQAAAIMAAFTYNAAMREGTFPRKPMPEERPAR
jgi:hypothetical protein